MTRYVISWFFKDARILDIHSHEIYITCKTEYPHFHRSKSSFYLNLHLIKILFIEGKIKSDGGFTEIQKNS